MYAEDLSIAIRCGDTLSPTWPFVQTLITCEVVDSTSNRAAELVREENVALPLAVWARTQTCGRGRGSRAWWSDRGSLTFTIALEPSAHGLAAASEPIVALATAVAVIDAIEEIGLAGQSIGIRWPNDLEVGGRKLGGILPERIETAHRHRLVIGVGLNVLTSLAKAPDEVRRMATALAALQPRAFDEETLPRLMATILRHVESVLGRLAGGDPVLAARWNQLDVLREQWVSVDLGTRVIAGAACGIDADGALCLDDGQNLHRVYGGQVLRTDNLESVESE